MAFPEIKNLDIRLRENMDDYVDCILEDKKPFDVIIIDGKHREECVKNALKKISSDGLIIADNSERAVEFEDCRKLVEKLRASGMLQVDFKGFGPLKNYTWVTTLFFKRTFDFPVKQLPPRPSIGGFLEQAKSQKRSKRLLRQ